MTHDTGRAVAPQFLPPRDAFGRTASLAFTTTFVAYGVRLEVRSNARAALDLAETTFGAWRGLDPALVRPGPPARLDVIVQPSDDAELPGTFRYRRHGPVFLAAAGSSVFSVLLEQQHAICFVPTLALSDAEWFRAHVNGCGLLAVTQRDRVPLHAAAVIWNDRAFLLTGKSGVGKSTLAYACAMAGFRVLSEEAVFVSLSDPSPRLWGWTPAVWLDTDAVRFFPQLSGRAVIARANGKRRLAASTGDPAPLLIHAGPVALVVLRGGRSTAALAPADDQAWDVALAASNEEGFDQYPHERPALITWLRTLPAYALDAGPDPHAAARMLKVLAGTVPNARSRPAGRTRPSTPEMFA